jgi:hypothetical protein
MCFMIARWMHRAEMSEDVECAVPAEGQQATCTRGKVEVVVRQGSRHGERRREIERWSTGPRTWRSTEPDLATMPLSNPSIPDPIDPPRPDALLEPLAHIGLGVNDPHAVRRVECHGEEDWVRVGLAPEEDEGVFARVCKGTESVERPGASWGSVVYENETDGDMR